MSNAVLMQILYAGLAGTLLALIVATCQQKWSLRVFFLLALRLAIGWHFLFEGLHKIHTHHIGPSENNKPFSSEPYFKAAPGPLGPYMRKQFGDVEAQTAAKLKGARELSSAEMDAMPPQRQASMCPLPVAVEIDDLIDDLVKAVEAEADLELKATDAAEAKSIEDADAAEQRAIKGQWNPKEVERIRDLAESDRKKAKALADGLRERIRTRNQIVQDVGKQLLGRLGGMVAVSDPIQKVLDGFRTDADKDIKSTEEIEAKSFAEAKATEENWLNAKWTPADLQQFAAKADAERRAAKVKADEARAAAKDKRANALSKFALARKETAKRKYALWVYGVEGRDTKLKGFSNDVAMTAPQRLEHIETLRKRVAEEEERLTAGLGNGYGIDQKKAAELRMELITAQSDLAKDINTFVADLKKEMFGNAKVPEATAPEPTDGQKMDLFTMWFLVVLGGCIMGGFFTRIACVAGCGFLLLTYLTHPPFPWFPLPPNTEGNPVFINKNAIEGLALLVLATFPTGRWLGVDALIARICGCGRNCDTQ